MKILNLHIDFGDEQKTIIELTGKRFKKKTIFPKTWAYQKKLKEIRAMSTKKL